MNRKEKLEILKAIQQGRKTLDDLTNKVKH